MPPEKPLLKRLIPLSIRPHEGETSPHLLDLRRHNAAREGADAEESDARRHRARSLEDKIALLDDRLREVPDFVKTGVQAASKVWQERAVRLFEEGLHMGAAVQERLKEAHARVRYRQARKTNPLKKSAGRYLGLGWMAVALVFLTIPLQGLLLYRAIDSAKRNFTQAWSGASTRMAALQSALADRNFDAIPENLGALRNDLGDMRAVFDRVRPVRMLLPERVKQADRTVRFVEQAVSYAHQTAYLLEQAQATGSGYGALVRSAAREIEALQSRAHTVFSADRDGGLLGSALGALDQLRDISALAAQLAASEETQHVLLVFQNPRELRATGGFAGSFALLALRDGKIESMDVPQAGTYAIQGQVPIAVMSPRPLHLINPRFEFQDANWWPDFPRSARKMVELYESSGGPTVDAVIAVTAEVGEEILRLHGPVRYGDAPLLDDTFVDALQEIIAGDRAQDRRAPKKVITALLPPMFEAIRISVEQKPRELFLTANRLIREKEIQIWARDEEAQASIRRLGWSGELPATRGDFLAVITSNVGGGKTDGVVDEDLRHDALIRRTGVAEETVRITRTHRGRKGDQFTGHRNAAYVRVYLSSDAKVIKATGSNPPASSEFEVMPGTLRPDPDVRGAELSRLRNSYSEADIWREGAHTVVGIWMVTEAGGVSEAAVVYEVPLERKGNIMPYTLIIEPQAGKRATIQSRIVLDKTINMAVAEDPLWDARGWSYEGAVDERIVTGGVLVSYEL